jgi:hypothetical protein
MAFEPLLLKRDTTDFDSHDLVNFATLREIYDGFVNSASELHRHTLEQIRIHESQRASVSEGEKIK